MAARTKTTKAPGRAIVQEVLARIPLDYADWLASLKSRISGAECARESRALAALRDALLPKLVSGELRVPDATQIVDSEA